MEAKKKKTNKKYVLPLVIGQIQMKITTRYHTHTKMVQLKKQKILSAAKQAEHLEIPLFKSPQELSQEN